MMRELSITTMLNATLKSQGRKMPASCSVPQEGLEKGIKMKHFSLRKRMG